MVHHVLEMPADEDAVRKLRVGDTVTLIGTDGNLLFANPAMSRRS